MHPYAAQDSLFEELAPFPQGFVYRPHFITEEEEKEMLEWFTDLPFEHGRLGEYFAKRRVVGFGYGYDFREHRIVPGPPLPPFLIPFARKVAKWLDIPKTRIVEALITEYPKGAGIGWHRDNESFEHVVGVSLGGAARLRLRPSSWKLFGRRRTREDSTELMLLPRSAYLLSNESRWRFQHSIASVPALRYSITFRTLPRGYPLPKRTRRSFT